MFNFKALEINTDFLTGTKYIFLPNNDGLLQEKKNPVCYRVSQKRQTEERDRGGVFSHAAPPWRDWVRNNVVEMVKYSCLVMCAALT